MRPPVQRLQAVTQITGSPDESIYALITGRPWRNDMSASHVPDEMRGERVPHTA